MQGAVKGKSGGKVKGQHFLLSAGARSLSIMAVARLGDDEAWEHFRLIRWAGTEGEPVCPHCGGRSVYTYSSRRIFCCKACGKQFSVTSGTIFASHKLPLRTCLMAIALFVNAAKGYSALQMSRDLDCQYRTAFVFCHKLREAMGSESSGRVASGTVEVDGAYFGGHVKPTNYAMNRAAGGKTRRSRKRLVVAVVRERHGRTFTFVVKREGLAVREIERRVLPGSIVHADEAPGWDPLHRHFEVKRIKHAEAYSHGEACTNQAESFFSRLRRAETGVHHHIAGPYLEDYAAEAAWREDARRISNGEQFLLLCFAALTAPPSERWARYWQYRRCRNAEPIGGRHIVAGSPDPAVKRPPSAGRSSA